MVAVSIGGAETIAVELNSATDNPLVLVEQGEAAVEVVAQDGEQGLQATTLED